MSQQRMFLVIILFAGAVTVGCSSQSSQSSFSPLQPYGRSATSLQVFNRRTVHRVNGHLALGHLSQIRTLFAGYSRRRHKIVTKWWGWTNRKTGRPIQARDGTFKPRLSRVKPNVTWTPQPTPSPGFGGDLYDCNNAAGIYCLYLVPGGVDGGAGYAEVLWCTDCSPSDTFYGYAELYPWEGSSPQPPPSFTTDGNSSTNTAFTDCTMSCTLSTCGSPWPTCWVQVINDPTGAPPYNLTNSFCTEPDCDFGGYQINWTILPTTQDMDGGGVPVNYNGSPPPVLPSPIMVGQQAQLMGSPAPLLTNVTWTFDSTAATDVVGNGFVQNVQVVGTPQPVPSSGNPISLYWVSANVPSGVRHVRMYAQAADVVGPLFADVYYPIGTPSPMASYFASRVQGSTDTVGHSPVGCPTPLSSFWALHVGIPCPTAPPTPAPGILMQYTVTVPSYGAGNIAVAQLLELTRFRGHFRSYSEGVHHGKTPHLPTGVPA